MVQDGDYAGQSYRPFSAAQIRIEKRKMADSIVTGGNY